MIGGSYSFMSLTNDGGQRDAFISDKRSFTCFGMMPNGFRRLAHIAAVYKQYWITIYWQLLWP